MTNRLTISRRITFGAAAIIVAGGVGAAVSAPAGAAPPCTAGAFAGTASGVLNQVSGFLDTHPEANDVLTAAASQPPEEARTSVRGYFTGHPGEFLELQGITRPLTDMRNQCGVDLSPTSLATLIDTISA